MKAEMTAPPSVLHGDVRELPATSLVEMIRAQAERCPTVIALEGPRSRLSYQELLCLSGAIADRLQTLGVAADDRVALWTTRSVGIVASALAVMELRAAWVPIDPSYPSHRVAGILGVARPSLIVFDGSEPGPSPPVVEGTTLLDVATIAPRSEPVVRPLPLPDDVAYVIFTSGSTGAPKGVMIEHLSLVNYVAWCADAMGSGGSGTPLFASLAFDHAVTCLWVPLATGKTVVLVPTLWDQAILFGSRSARYGFLKITPSHVRFFERMSQPDYGRLSELLMFGGERLDPGLIDRLGERLAGMRLMNHYGPTEATVGCCYHEFSRQNVHDWTCVPIGRPVWNSRAYVVDEDLQPVPVGTPGELIIAGQCVARGYLDRKDETALRFIDEGKVGGPAGQRAYRTGDIVQVLESGVLLYVGRRDDQIKIGGHRIELGELRLHALAVDGISDVAFNVVAGDVETIEAFIVPRDPTTALDQLTQALRVSLKSALPPAIVPKKVHVVDQLAFNVHGKFDLEATRVLADTRNSIERGNT